MPADSAVTADAPQANAQPKAQIEDSSLHPITEADASDLMDKLGIPAKLREGLNPPKEQVAQTAEVSTAPESEPETESDTETETTEETPVEAVSDESGEDEGEDEEEPAANTLTPREQKLHKRNYKLRLRARRAEDRAAELEQKLERAGNQEPVQITPTLAEPLAHITTLEQLEAEKFRFKTIRDVARQNPNGWVAHEGTPQEEVVEPKQAAQWLSYAEDVLNEKVPAKLQELTLLRPQATQRAQNILPDLFKAGTTDNQAYQQILRGFPQIATHPERDYLAALIALGLKTEAAGQSRNGKNGKLEIPDKILKAHEDRDKTPVKVQTPPGRSTPPPLNQSKAMDDVLAAIKKSGGSRDSLKAGLAMLGTNGSSPRSRQPVPV